MIERPRNREHGGYARNIALGLATPAGIPPRECDDVAMGGRYWDTEPELVSAERVVPLRLPDLSLDLHTDRGVFGASAVDRGTQILLRRAPAPVAGRSVVDLGTGYGPIASVLAHRAPAAGVWAVDVNRRALALTARNTAGLDNVVTATPAEIPQGLRFDAIYSNPPIKVGKEPLRELLSEWLSRLAPGGSAWLVVKQSMGADSLQHWLIDSGHSTGRAASKQGYRLLTVDADGPSGSLAPEDLTAVREQTSTQWTVMGRIPGLFAAGIHLLHHRGGWAVLKLCSGPGWTEQLERLQPTVAALRRNGYPTPEVLGTGALDGDRSYLLTEWIPHGSRSEPNRQRVEALLDAALVHAEVRPPAGRDWSAMVTSFLNGGVRDLAFHPSIAPLAERTLDLLPAPVPALAGGHFVHGDFSVENALFRGDVLHAVTDLDGFGTGTPAIDLTALAAHLDPDLQRLVIERGVELAGADAVAACLCHRVLAGLAWATEHPQLLPGAPEYAHRLLSLVP